MPQQPAWQRWLLAALLLGLGGFGLIGGVFDLCDWVSGLRGGAALLHTESLMLVLPLLGCSLIIIGAAVSLPPVALRALPRTMERVAIVGLAGCAITILLLIPAPLIADGVTRANGYRRCSLDHGIRVTFTTWARAGAPCPEESEE